MQMKNHFWGCALFHFYLVWLKCYAESCPSQGPAQVFRLATASFYDVILWEEGRSHLSVAMEPNRLEWHLKKNLKNGCSGLCTSLATWRWRSGNINGERWDRLMRITIYYGSLETNCWQGHKSIQSPQNPITYKNGQVYNFQNFKTKT